MNDEQKKRQLRNYKMFATGLFVLMAILFVVMTILEKKNHAHWIGYIRAFSEAAMVGALADWFAVTALFNYPLGIKIPHTNLIENSKERIGDNLGNFVVENFLSPQNIRPYIQKIKISNFVGDWLSKERNQENLMKEVSTIILDILNKLDDTEVVNFIGKKAKEMSNDLKINEIIGNGIEYILDKKDHQRFITNLSKQIKDYVLNNQEMVKNRVKKESYFLVPKFVDDGIADKITKGLSKYFEEVELDEDHPLRNEITEKLYSFSTEIKTEEKWVEEFRDIKNDFLKEEKINQYSTDIWNSIKKSLTKELEEQNSTLKNYIQRNLAELSQNLKTDEKFQNKIDHWIRVTAYKYILKNTHQFGALISSTVGNWEGKQLSEKLELEVGKDLQFIRVNGTIVGGLVGLVIYTVANFFI
ncbi:MULTISPECIES: DUF445 domain-containing protein [Kaistella]|uniref:Membrane protein n=2 Tax=Kaistella TaxID=2782231 RepID=A0A0C1CY15_9FLAO|nr:MULTISPECIES: DUF445 domain-containing protein [Kaistella]KIA89256.1 membrane protein [Kaistella jeonii]MBF8457641.1 DUF445 domain-containing protein [Kaistella gelatinilytica]SFC01209.1 Uncharacterized membrane-anchored protein YjiN, DUF445 family [Kaistella jeonii]VEI96565.1 Predicted membrane protein [Kaistella jeonii]